MLTLFLLNLILVKVFSYLLGDCPEILIKLEQALMESVHFVSTPLVSLCEFIGQQWMSRGQPWRRLHQFQHCLLQNNAPSVKQTSAHPFLKQQEAAAAPKRSPNTTKIQEVDGTGYLNSP